MLPAGVASVALSVYGQLPGCWMLTNSVLLSGVNAIPVTSHSFGPTKKRRRSTWFWALTGTCLPLASTRSVGITASSWSLV
ncbi:hypothetical protein D3C85_1837900 [compost metagenome]